MHRLLIGSAALALSLCANAAMVSRNQDGESVRLFDAPCKNAKILAEINPEHRNMMRAGEAKLRIGTFQFCWAVGSNGVVFMRYEDGDVGMIPVQAFTREEGV